MLRLYPRAVFKVNTYSYVLAPWTNKTVMAAIDNEKSISMPMDCEAEAQLKNPAQILWGKITPTYNQTQVIQWKKTKYLLEYHI